MLAPGAPSYFLTPMVFSACERAPEKAIACEGAHVPFSPSSRVPKPRLFFFFLVDGGVPDAGHFQPRRRSWPTQGLTDPSTLSSFCVCEPSFSLLYCALHAGLGGEKLKVPTGYRCRACNKWRRGRRDALSHLVTCQKTLTREDDGSESDGSPGVNPGGGSGYESGLDDGYAGGGSDEGVCVRERETKRITSALYFATPRRERLATAVMWFALTLLCERALFPALTPARRNITLQVEVSKIQPTTYSSSLTACMYNI